jgi:transcriptional regulator with XRE-family HTH domain
MHGIQKETGDPLPGARIRALREQKNLKLKDFAKLAGFDRSNLSRIERGKIGVTLQSGRRLAAALDVSLPDLFSSFALPVSFTVPVRGSEPPRSHPTSVKYSNESFALQISDDSMFPLLSSTDMVICDPAQPVTVGELVAASLADTFVVRRLVQTVGPAGTGEILDCESPRWQKLQIDKKTPWKILGPIVERTSYRIGIRDSCRR